MGMCTTALLEQVKCRTFTAEQMLFRWEQRASQRQQEGGQAGAQEDEEQEEHEMDFLVHQVRRALCVAEQEGVRVQEGGDEEHNKVRRAALSELWCAVVDADAPLWATLCEEVKQPNFSLPKLENQLSATLLWNATYQYAKVSYMQAPDNDPGIGNIPYTGNSKPTKALLSGADYSREKLDLLDKAIGSAEERARHGDELDELDDEYEDIEEEDEMEQ
jgi:hypothetical protein